MRILVCEGHTVEFERATDRKSAMKITETFESGPQKHSSEKFSSMKDAIAYMKELTDLGYVSAN